MFLSKFKLTTAIVAALLVGLGGGLLAYRPVAADPLGQPRDNAPRQVVDQARDNARHIVAMRKPEAAPALANDPAQESKMAAKMAEMDRPVGTWERKVGAYQIVLRINADHVVATIAGRDGDTVTNWTVDADYSVTKDHLLYGIITSIEANALAEPDDGELALYVDYTFSVCYRVDGDVLTIKNFKFGALDGDVAKETLMFMGKYKKRTGRDKDEGR